jgi:hypothetical protein
VEREYSSYSFSTSALDRGEWSASRPGRALGPGKGTPVPIVQQAGRAAGAVWTQGATGKILSPLPGSNLDRPVVQSVARHYTDWGTRLTMYYHPICIITSVEFVEILQQHFLYAFPVSPFPFGSVEFRVIWRHQRIHIVSSVWLERHEELWNTAGSLEQSPSSESYFRSTGQEISRLLLNSNVRYLSHNSAPLLPNMKWMNPVHSLTHYSFDFILVLSSNLRLPLPSSLFLSSPPTKIL